MTWSSKTPFLLIFAFILLSLLVSAGTLSAAPDVVGGQAADPGEYPWQVYMESGPQNNVGQCGGSLIHPKWVLTAAHCFYNEDDQLAISPVVLSIGDHDVSVPEGGEQFPTVSQVILHEDHDISVGDGFNDIALLELESPVQTSENVKPVSLAETPFDSPLVVPGKRATVIGWGGIDENAEEASPVLLELEYTIDTCISAFRHTQMCMSTEGRKGNCDGDSGGPLMVRRPDGEMVQVGIVSLGTGRSCGRGQDVYTRVSEFRGWIESQTGLSLGSSIVGRVYLPMLARDH